jgi:preprotein translocase subunit SecA
VEYKREAFAMFEVLTGSIREETVRTLFRANLVMEPAPPSAAARVAERPAAPAIAPRVRATPKSESHAEVSAFGTPVEEGGAPATGTAPRRAPAPALAQEPKVGRNDPCPCGSGKKYKKCHGA